MLDVEQLLPTVKAEAAKMVLNELRVVRDAWRDMDPRFETPARNRHNVDTSLFGGFGGALLGRLKPQVFRLADLEELIERLETEAPPIQA